jgi:hypothetical protein
MGPRADAVDETVRLLPENVRLGLSAMNERPAMQKIHRGWNRLLRGLESFTYEPETKKLLGLVRKGRDPALEQAVGKTRNEIRLNQESHIDASYKANADLVESVFQPMTKSKDPKGAYRTFVMLVATRDFLASKLARPGGKVPGGATVTELQQAYGRLQTLAKDKYPEALEARRGHDAITARIGKNLFERGFIKAEVVDRPYYTHELLEAQNWYSAPRWEQLPGALRTPGRSPYTLRRSGTEKLINMDYMDVMQRHLTRWYTDNAQEQLVFNTARRFDELYKQPGRLSTESLDVLETARKQNATGTLEVPEGRFRWWSPVRMPEHMRGKEAAELKMHDFVSAQLQSLKADPKTPKFLLPELLADRLDQFYMPNTSPLGIQIARRGTQALKHWTLFFAGLPYQGKNLIGDLMRIGWYDIGALSPVQRGGRLGVRPGYIPRAAGQLLRPQTRAEPIPELPTRAGIIDAEIRNMLELAVSQRIGVARAGGTRMAEAGGGLGSMELIGHLPKLHHEPAMAPFRTKLQQADVWNPMRIYDIISAYRESIPRYGYFMRQMDRVAQGKPVKAAGLDLEALKPYTIEAAGKATREVLIDYGAVSKNFDIYARGLLLPFSTFYVKNFNSLAKSMKNDPGNAATKLGLPLAAIWYWNNVIHGDIEKTFSPYTRDSLHLTTAIQDGEGKNYVFQLDDPAHVAASMVGVQTLPRIMGDLAGGRLTPEEAGEEIAKAVVGAAPGIGSIMYPDQENAWMNLLNQAIKAGGEVTANRNLDFGGEIYPSAMAGRPEAHAAMARHVLARIALPAQAYMRSTFSEEFGTPTGLEEGVAAGGKTAQSWILDQFLDWERAVGMRRVDVEAEAQKRMRTAAREERGQDVAAMDALDDIILRFDVDYQTDPESAETRKQQAIDEWYERYGLNPSPQRLQQRYGPNRPEWQVKRWTNRMKLAPEGSEEREQAREALNWWRWQVTQAVVGGRTPLTVRPEAVERARELLPAQ